MAILNLDYYKGEDLYSDGDVENEVLEYARKGPLSGDLGDVKFPVLYHLSKVRENILNWYPFKEGASAIEIGSGCGAITGLLCRRLSRVVSVELSKRRAQINYTRHKELENLELYVGNMNDMEFGRKFDYVILNGVFEYAMSFTPCERPYETFLQNISRFLKPDGMILIAIENRLGLKYFAGAPEDHTDGYFDGLRGYEGNHSVRTFSRGEWEQLMQRCGFSCYKFYYPYPDYKFPQEIFTDLSLGGQKYGRPSWNFTKYRMALFSEEKMAAALQQEGVMAQFANSFLIEMSRTQPERDREVLYAKLGTDRSPEFAAATVIEQRGDKKYAVKIPMEEKAEKHIRHLLDAAGMYDTWQPLPGKAEGKNAVYPFLSGKSLGQKAALAVQNGDMDEVKRLLDEAALLCGDKGLRHCRAEEMTEEEREQFCAVFGDHELEADAVCVSPANIDLILDNIFEPEEAGGRYQVIDCEWIFDFPVPLSFLLWRAVNELYSTQPSLMQLYPKEKLLGEYGITPEMSGAFHRWSTYFAEEYVGANRLLKRSIPEIGVSIEEFRQKMKERDYMICQLFIDTGNGFTEEQKLVKEIPMTDGTFSASFDLRGFEQIQALRFDPLEGRPCICRIDGSTTTAKLSAENAAAKTEDGDLFLTTDPIYRVGDVQNAAQLTICGRLTVLAAEDALNRANAMLQKANHPFGFLHGRRKRM